MQDVSKNMRLTGMLLFRDALSEAIWTKRSRCVVHMAQAAEILLKARIADEHPLLIFSKIPSQTSNQTRLSLADLLEKGRTFSYAELPDQLWATTGTQIENIKDYRAFGKLRNQIIHFSMTNQDDLDLKSLKYGLEILDPLIKGFWGTSVLEFFTKYPWNETSQPDWYEFSENQAFRKKLDLFPGLRHLQGEAAVLNWELYKQTMAQEKADWEEKVSPEYFDSGMEEEYAMCEECEREERKKKNAQWEDFLTQFRSKPPTR